MSAPQTGIAVTVASRPHDAPSRALHYRLSREGYPVKKSGRNGLLPLDTESETKPTVAHLQQVAFGLVRDHVRRFEDQICVERRIHGTWNVW
jgi:hypothetical protein